MCCKCTSGLCPFNRIVLVLLFIPNLFSHSSTESFLFPGDLILPDGIHMYILYLDFSSFSTTLFSSNRKYHHTVMSLLENSEGMKLLQCNKVSNSINMLKLKDLFCFMRTL